MVDSCSQVVYKGFKFLITTAPNSSNLDKYIKDMQRRNVKVVIRFCEPIYETDYFKCAGITHVDLFIPDGSAPSQDILKSFFDILKDQYLTNKEPCVGMHCKTGLGRAPLMVAVALIELGVPYEDAVALVREKRRGAINAKQMEYLSKYKRRNSFEEDRRASCTVQ